LTHGFLARWLPEVALVVHLARPRGAQPPCDGPPHSRGEQVCKPHRGAGLGVGAEPSVNEDQIEGLNGACAYEDDPEGHPVLLGDTTPNGLGCGPHVHRVRVAAPACGLEGVDQVGPGGVGGPVADVDGGGRRRDDWLTGPAARLCAGQARAKPCQASGAVELHAAP
jgi:hypothetical protein